MKLVTLKGKSGAGPPYERLGRIDGDRVIPFDFPKGLFGLIQTGQEGLAVARSETGESEPFDPADLAAPITLPSKIIAVGKNYADHAQETKSAIPDHPIIFTKFTTAIIGPGQAITWDPALTGQVDFEAELAVVIGKKARRVPKSEALNYVFGYMCANDISARDLQYGDGQWVRGKSLDTFCPLGPWLVTAEEIPDPQDLDIRSILNGQTMQNSHTGKMIFSVAYLISFLSRAFTLLPGDIILTGTPDGVGAFRDPPVYLKDGDEIIVEIEGVGRLVNRCATSDSSE